MHAGLMTLIVIVTAVIGTGPSRSEEPRLADKTPDGAQLIDLYKAARTVADVEAANGKVKDEVLTVQSVPSDLARLHVAKMTVCEEVEMSHLEATAAKARAFSVVLIRINGELPPATTPSSARRCRSCFALDDVTRLAADGESDVRRWSLAATAVGRPCHLNHLRGSDLTSDVSTGHFRDTRLIY